MDLTKLELESLVPEDESTPLERKIIHIYDKLASDFGGEEELSEHQKEILQRLAFLYAKCSEYEYRFTVLGEGGLKELNTYASLCKTAMGLARHLGTKRKQKQVTATHSPLMEKWKDHI